MLRPHLCYVKPELSCFYWCCCFVHMLGDLIILADSLGIELFITFKAGGLMLRWLWGAIAQWSEHLHLKQEALGSIPSDYPRFFLFQLAY